MNHEKKIESLVQRLDFFLGESINIGILEERFATYGEIRYLGLGFVKGDQRERTPGMVLHR